MEACGCVSRAAQLTRTSTSSEGWRVCVSGREKSSQRDKRGGDVIAIVLASKRWYYGMVWHGYRELGIGRLAGVVCVYVEGILDGWMDGWMQIHRLICRRGWICTWPGM